MVVLILWPKFGEVQIYQTIAVLLSSVIYVQLLVLLHQL